MKKVSSLVLLVIFILGLAACGGGSPQAPAASTPAPSTTEPSSPAPPAASAPSAAASNYPTREIRYIVPYAPGGASDAYARIVVEYLSPILGVPIVIDNIPGAACVIGWTELYNQPADGYTITMGSTVACPWSVVVFSPEKPPWDPDVFLPVGSICRSTGTGGIFCKRGRWSNWLEMVEEAKANPGKIKLGVQGPGQPSITSFYEIEKIFGIEFNKIYYADAASQQTDVIIGDLDLGTTTTGRADFIANESFTILTQTGDKFPEGYPITGLPMLSDFEEEFNFEFDDTMYISKSYNRQDLYVRADTDPAIVAKLEDALRQLNEVEGYRNAISNVSWPHFETSEEALDSYHALTDTWNTFFNDKEYTDWLAKISN